MKFRTELEVSPAKKQIAIDHSILTIGSCFAENISTYLRQSFFNLLENPFGVLYNPFSIATALQLILSQKSFTKEDLILHQGEWHSFWHHSTFSHHNPEICLQKINHQIQAAHQFLKQADWLIVTFGTAYVYLHRQLKSVVANCHKLPEAHFHRKLLTVEEITYKWQQTVGLLKKFNLELKIILTISPVRHFRDGFIENQKSKATLILATHQILTQTKDHFYFPAYEIVLDDLRDYRFYEANLTHPNQLAVDYIWKKFQKMFFTKTTRQSVSELLKFRSRLTHKVRNPHSPQALLFMEETRKQWLELKQRYPHLHNKLAPFAEDKNSL